MGHIVLFALPQVLPHVKLGKVDDLILIIILVLISFRDLMPLSVAGYTPLPLGALLLLHRLDDVLAVLLNLLLDVILVVRIFPVGR